MANAPLIHIPGGGSIPVKSDVIALRTAEMQTLADMHELAYRQGLVIFCKACQQPLHGENDGNGRIWTVECLCRVWKADMGVPGRS